MLEEFEENPFLKGFYKDPERYGFSVEMSFLADRYHQLTNRLVDPDLFSPLLISDYAPFKSLIFAQNNLSVTEFNLYRKFWQMAIGPLNKADLVIFLMMPVSALQENIKKRGRVYEQNISDEYLKKVSLGYENYLIHLDKTNVLRLDATNHDFLNSSEDLDYISSLIMNRLDRD
jgi:deoxyadenosine/deoxycytidine kinase